MTSLAVRVPEETLAALDALVTDGRYATRTAAVRAALDALLQAHGNAEIDRQIMAEYSAHPQTDEDVAIARAAGLALIDQEPW